MNTRSGDIDPTLPAYLSRKMRQSPEALVELLNHESGLLGLSGISGDMQELLGNKSAPAKTAVAAYCYRVRKYIGAYVAALGGLDGILFGGGIGENAPEIRRAVLEGCEVFGVKIDVATNEATIGKAGRISANESPVDVRIAPPNEAKLMVEDALHLLSPTVENTHGCRGG